MNNDFIIVKGFPERNCGGVGGGGERVRTLRTPGSN